MSCSHQPGRGRYEAVTIKKLLMFQGIPVVLYARVFIDGGRVAAVRSLRLQDEHGHFPPTVDVGTLDELPELLR